MATAGELVLRARATDDAKLLDQAEALARDGTEWFAIAESYPDGARDRAAYCLSRALAAAATDVRVYRSIARIHRTRFRDDAAAAKALAACAAVLLAGETSTADWCLLAHAWETLGDRDAALDYLQHARACAHTVPDWCAVGELDRAERAARSVHDRIAIAKACDDAQDLDRLISNLAAGVDAITEVGDAVAMMRALERFDASDDDRARCYQAGKERATTAAELVVLSSIAPTERECVRCLEAAEPIADADERKRIEFLARAHRARGGAWDETQIPLLEPSQLVPWSARSLGWPHDPARLFDLLRGRIDAARLRTIASCDYGMDVAEHTAALEQIVRGRIPHPLAWFPLEVLQLTRWEEGPSTDHVARAFCACVLCLDEAGPTSMHDGNESTIPVLLHSCLVLGTEAVDAAIGFFAAMASSCDDGVVRAFAELAMVLAAVWRDADDPRIRAVVLRLFHEEPTLRANALISSEGWLLGCTNFDQRHALFRELARVVLAPSIPHDPALAQLAALISGT